VTYVSTVLFNLDMGLGASMGFALLTVIFRTQRLESFPASYLSTVFLALVICFILLLHYI